MDLLGDVPRYIHNPAKDLLLADSVATGGLSADANGVLDDVSKHLDAAWQDASNGTARLSFAGGVDSGKTTAVGVFDAVKADVDSAWRCEPEQMANPDFHEVLPIGRYGMV